ncbi:hypothetical protein [Saccharothrix sp.]|uniref:hypothetical protein n=1 Tax=Saccharothrix sp. TaxID=1873460 RepID=UPI002811244A|nr:hypothetical protein [Saccharothrix sp.]
MDIEFSTTVGDQLAGLGAVAGWRDDIGVFYATVEGPDRLLVDLRASLDETTDAAIVLEALRAYVNPDDIDAVASVLAGNHDEHFNPSPAHSDPPPSDYDELLGLPSDDDLGSHAGLGL